MNSDDSNDEQEYDFTLVLGGVSELTDDLANALFEAGCDDATPGCRSGRVTLSFDREGRSFRSAVMSAIRDVMKSGAAHVIAVENCNLVTQSDIARRIGRSRQMITQYISGIRGLGDFPGPVYRVDGGRSLWSWQEVSAWLYRNGVIDRRAVREAEDIATINSMLDMAHQQRLNPELAREVAELAIS